MQPPPTDRIYLLDDHCFETEAVIISVREDTVALDRTCFYPGGGGQPPDAGWLKVQTGPTLEITGVYADPAGVLWHVSLASPPPAALGQPVRAILNKDRRLALMRYHTVLHVLNTITLRDYNAWITGVQIGVEHSRIDFKIEAFSPALCAELEAKVNAVLVEAHPLRSYYLSEEEFNARPDLLRTLVAKPPVMEGRVRVVEIEGFDAQACGGTHVRTTAEVGAFSIFRTENKGRLNKRLYVRLTP
jgi:misacylated tRNA(Ala) deacylase